MQLRKIIKTRGHFPNDEAAIKLLWLALRNVLNKSVRAAFDWKSAMNQFAIMFGDRFTQARLMAANGFSSRQIAREVGVNQSTIVRWLKQG